MVDREQHPVGYKVAPSKDALHPRQQKPPEEQLLAEHGVEDGEHDDHREPAPRSAEELLATGIQEQAEVSVGGSGHVEAEQRPEDEEEDEGNHPQPDPAPHAAAPRIAG